MDKNLKYKIGSLTRLVWLPAPKMRIMEEDETVSALISSTGSKARVSLG